MTKPKRKPARGAGKVRKPNGLWPSSCLDCYIDWHAYKQGEFVFMGAGRYWLDAKECRRLASWLERSADYLQYMEKKK